MPLLPHTRLYACPGCHEHVRAEDDACPHCGAELRGEGWVARAASAILVGLALTGCPDKGGPVSTSVEPEYGVPTSGPMTGTGSTGSTGSTGTGTGTGTGTIGGTFEPEYGVPTSTTPPMTTGSTGATGSTGSTGGPEPDYGVPATTDGTASSGSSSTTA